MLTRLMYQSDDAESRAGEVRGAIGGLMMGGLRGDLQCSLFFAEDRIIVIRSKLFWQILGTHGVNPLSSKPLVGEEYRAQLGRLLAQVNLNDGKEIVIPLSEVTRIEVGRKWMQSRLSFHMISGIVYRFKFPPIKLETIESAVQTLLPPSVVSAKLVRSE